MSGIFSTERSDAVRAAANILFAGAQASVGQLSRVTKSGKPIDVRAAETDNPVIPLAPAFAIWGPIFAANFAHAARTYTRRDDPLIRRTGWLSAAAFAGSTAWELWSQYRGIGWRSVGIILAPAVAANTAMLTAVNADEDEPSRDLVLNSMAPLAGWLTVATAADIASARVAEGGATGPITQTRAALAIVAATTAAASTLAYTSRGEPRYAAAAGWGLAGIAVRNLKDRNRPVAVAALAGLAAVAGATLLARRRT